MPTKQELFNQLKIEIASGKGLHDSVHLVNHDAEAKRRKENKKQSTRVIMDTYSPESYSEFHQQRERFIRTAVDPSIGIHLMIRALAEVSDDTLRQWLTDGHQAEGDQPGPGPEKARLPEWLL